MAQQFVTTGPVEAVVRLGSGEVVIERAEPGTASADVRALDPEHEPSVRLAASTQVRFEGDRLDIRVPEQGRLFRRGEVRVALTLPPSSTLALKAGAVDVSVEGGLVELEAKIGSGSVRIDSVDGMAVKAGQVDVQVDRAGAVAVSTGQGTLRAQHVGDTVFKTGSGNVELGRTEGDVAVKGGSVDLTIHEAQSGNIAFTTGSGDAHVCVVTGTTVELDLTSGSGDVRCDLPMESSAPPGGAGLRLRLKTGSGDLRVAATAPV
jgi:DUF4097 and DUF4098 domain-containing protein YvlB